ncbi:MAG: S8 family serine peptidase, partial [Geminicoccales bacterium]
MKHAKHLECLRTLLLSTALCSAAVCLSGVVNESRAQSLDPFELLNSTGLLQINAPEAYALPVLAEGGEGVVIAIIDTGIDETHPDLAPNLVGSFLIGGATNVAGSHGTAVAGIAAGAAGNGGTMGVAYNAGIVSYQGGDIDPNDPNSINFDNDAIATSITAAAGGFPDVANTEADIINMSLGVPLSGPLLLNTGEVVAANENAATPAIEEALRFAVENEKLIVVAAGNDFNNLPVLEDSLGVPRGTIVDIGAGYPAQFANRADLAPGMIAVMAVDENNERAFFSNSCLGVEARCLAAPGVDFQGALPGGGTGNIGSGTSYAAPMVAGAAAVVQAAFGVSPQEAGDRLLTTATDLGAVGVDSVFGHGLLDLENALSP